MSLRTTAEPNGELSGSDDYRPLSTQHVGTWACVSWVSGLSSVSVRREKLRRALDWGLVHTWDKGVISHTAIFIISREESWVEIQAGQARFPVFYPPTLSLLPAHPSFQRHPWLRPCLPDPI